MRSACAMRRRMRKVSCESVDIPKIVGYVRCMTHRSTRMNPLTLGLKIQADRARGALLLLVLVLITTGGVG